MNQATNTNLKNLTHYFFDKDTTTSFVEFLMKQAQVIAPHAKGEVSYSYQVVQNPKEVVLDYSRTIQPLKKYFLPPRETLLKFNLTDNSYAQAEIAKNKKIFFGIHSYEMEGVKRLDYSFSRGHAESNYLTRRENCRFIGVSYKPDQFHFSKSVGIEIEALDGFILFFDHQPDREGYVVYVVEEEGRNLIESFGKGQKLNGEFSFTKKDFQNKIKLHYNRLPQVFNHVYNSRVWDAVAEKCVGCGTCNLLCSTCFCFNVEDEIELNAEDGSRTRSWDGCMLRGFAEVAGGENFRDKLHQRTRHRLYRKFKYITENSGEIHCVGCGRCSKYCPAGISLVDVINDLIDDYATQQKKNLS